jgi:hypothetical protein
MYNRLLTKIPPQTIDVEKSERPSLVWIIYVFLQDAAAFFSGGFGFPHGPNQV